MASPIPILRPRFCNCSRKSIEVVEIEYFRNLLLANDHSPYQQKSHVTQHKIKREMKAACKYKLFFFSRFLSALARRDSRHIPLPVNGQQGSRYPFVACKPARYEYGELCTGSFGL